MNFINTIFQFVKKKEFLQFGHLKRINQNKSAKTMFGVYINRRKSRKVKST